MSKESDRCYDATFFEKDADGRPKGANVFAVTDAKEVIHGSGSSSSLPVILSLTSTRPYRLVLIMILVLTGI